jgi:hypothetical protein
LREVKTVETQILINCIFFVPVRTACHDIPAEFGSLASHGQLLPSYGDSRTATTGWQFLKVVPDARSAGMGESFLAVTR